jgi:AcrR family transcriptional regulator
MLDEGTRAPATLARGRHGLPREFVVRSQRERLLDAMAQACAERGYGEVRVADIVRRAGVSRATFYELFRDREECFLAAYDAILAQWLTVISAAYRQEGTWAYRARAAIAAALEFMAAEPAFARMCIVEVLAAGPRAIERYLAAIRILGSLADEAQAYAPAGAVLPSIVGRAAIAGAAGLVRGEILAGRTEQLPALLPDIVYVLAAAYLGHDQALAELQTAREGSEQQ